MSSYVKKKERKKVKGFRENLGVGVGEDLTVGSHPSRGTVSGRGGESRALSTYSGASGSEPLLTTAIQIFAGLG